MSGFDNQITMNKGKKGSLEEILGEVGKKGDRILFDFDYDGYKSSDKEAVIEKKVIQNKKVSSNILKDTTHNSTKVDTFLKNGTFIDSRRKDFLDVEELIALIINSSSNSGSKKKSKKDTSQQETIVLESEIFPEQKEIIHTPLLSFLYELIANPENDENFKKIVWAFISKMKSEKTVENNNLPSGFKMTKEIKYKSTASPLEGYSDRNASGEEYSGPAIGGSKRKYRNKKQKKQRGGELILDETTLDATTFTNVQEESLYYSVLDNDAVTSTTLDFLGDLQKLGSGNPFPFSLLFFDLETLENDWLVKPANVDILLGLLKEKERGIIVADPELEFVGTDSENAYTLRATFRSKKSLYGVFVNNKVVDLNTVVNLLGGMELVEKMDVPERKVTAPAATAPVTVPISSTLGTPQTTPRTTLVINNPPVVDASKITDNILKTAIRIVVDSLKKSKNLKPEKGNPPQEQEQELDTTSSSIPVITPGQALANYKEEKKENEYISKPRETFIPEEEFIKLDEFDPTIKDIFEKNELEIELIKNNNNQFNEIISNYNVIEQEDSVDNQQFKEEIQPKINTLSSDVEELKKLMLTLLTGLTTAITDKTETEDASIQTQSDVEDKQKIIDQFKIEYDKQVQPKILELQAQVQTLQTELNEKVKVPVDSEIDEKMKLLMEQNKALLAELEKLKKEKHKPGTKEQETQINTVQENNQFENINSTNLSTLPTATKAQILSQTIPLDQTLVNTSNSTMSSSRINSESSEAELQGGKKLVHFKISEKGLRVGPLKKNSKLISEDALIMSWNYLKYIRIKYKTKEEELFAKLIKPLIILERIHMCQNLLTIVEKLTNVERIEKSTIPNRINFDKSNTKKIHYFKNVSEINSILNLSLSNSPLIKKHQEIYINKQEFKPLIEYNILYYLSLKKKTSKIIEDEIQKRLRPETKNKTKKNNQKNDTLTSIIKELKDQSIPSLFSNIRYVFDYILNKINDIVTGQNDYFNDAEIITYKKRIDLLNIIIKDKIKSLESLSNNNNKNIEIIKSISSDYNDVSKSVEIIDINPENDISDESKTILNKIYNKIDVNQSNNIMTNINENIKKIDSTSYYKYPSKVYDIIDNQKLASINVPIPKNIPSTGLETKSNPSGIIIDNITEYEDTEIYSIGKIDEEVLSDVQHIKEILNSIENDVTLTNEKIGSETDRSDSSSNIELKSVSDGLASENSTNSAKTVNTAKRLGKTIDTSKNKQT